jgi:hypothetical protein
MDVSSALVADREAAEAIQPGQGAFDHATMPSKSLARLDAELQPAEHLWPLTNDALINQHFAASEDLEDAQFARCAALQRRAALIRSTTSFHWWPQRITDLCTNI